MAVLIISDLHLDPAHPARTELFERLLAGAARRAQRLLILGDLFESWIGDDDDDPLAARIAGALNELARAGVRIAFQHGNRDFLLGPHYAARCGMQLLPEEAFIENGNERILLLHGDSLCTDDTAYQAVRSELRDPAWQRAFLARPLPERRAIAIEARRQSRMHSASIDTHLADVSPAAVTQVLRRHGVHWLIHGHTHRPALHHLLVEGVPARRYVTADWRDDSAELLWLSTAADGTSLVTREVFHALP